MFDLLRLRPNHQLYIRNTVRMGEEDGRNWQGIKTHRYANWDVKIRRVLPPTEGYTEGIEQHVVNADRDHLLVALWVVWRDYWHWKRKYPIENPRDWIEDWKS